MFSVYTTDGVLAYAGPDGKPYEDRKSADTDAQERNQRAEAMGLKGRYVAQPTGQR